MPKPNSSSMASGFFPAAPSGAEAGGFIEDVLVLLLIGGGAPPVKLPASLGAGLGVRPRGGPGGGARPPAAVGGAEPADCGGKS